MITEFQEKLVELEEINLTADQEQALGALLVEQSDLIERIKIFLHKIG